MAHKALERIRLDQFVEAMDLHPDSVEECEPPDFILRFGANLIGVEVTDSLPKRESGKILPQEQASLRDRVMSLGASSTKPRAAIHCTSQRTFSSTRHYLVLA